jgi:hypothetical protein
MAAVEALNTLHGIGNKVTGVDDKMRGVQSALKAVENVLQGLDGRVKDIGDKVIDGANAISNWSPPAHNNDRIGFETLGQHIATDFDAVTEKGSKAVRGVGDNGGTGELEEVRNGLRASNIDEKQGAMKDIVARIIDGARVILN